MSFGFDPEAIYQDADIEQAELEAAGNEYARRARKSAAAREAGDLDAAAAACPHGHGYPLDSPAARHENDPGAGEAGYRCLECGSRLDASPWDDGRVTVACEVNRWNVSPAGQRR